MCALYKVVKITPTNYTKVQIPFSWVHGNLCVYCKHKNRWKSHDQCVNLYLFFIFLIFPLSTLVCLALYYWIDNTRPNRRVFCPGVTQGLTHLEWDFISFLPIYSFSLRRHFFYPTFTFHSSLGVFVEETKKANDEWKAVGESRKAWHIWGDFYSFPPILFFFRFLFFFLIPAYLDYLSWVTVLRKVTLLRKER